MKKLLDRLDDRDPKNIIKIKEREETLSVTTKLYNNRQKVINAFKVGIFPHKDEFQKKEPDASDKTLPDWVKVDRKRFNLMKNQIQNAKKNNIQARPKRGRPIYFNKSYRLIQDIVQGKITYEEPLKTITSIRDDIARLYDLDDFNENQVKVVNALFMIDEIFTRELKWYKLTDKGYILLRSKNND